VVASRSLVGQAYDLTLGVSIPFIAGQWSLLFLALSLPGGDEHVSIPFIAGQWSLPRNRADAERLRKGFNPLHCGAVVASLRC